jgi:hypothetical protein
MTAATRSSPEWIASEMTDTEPMATPTTILSTTSVELEATDSHAAAVLRRWWSGAGRRVT